MHAAVSRYTKADLCYVVSELVQETVKSSLYVRPQYMHFESLLVK